MKHLTHLLSLVIVVSLLKEYSDTSNAQDIAIAQSQQTFRLYTATEVVQANSNSPGQVALELLDTNTVKALVSSLGLPLLRQSHFSTQPINEREITLFCTGMSSASVSAVKDQFLWYIGERAEGHSHKFLLACLTNRVDPLSVGDKAIRALLSTEPYIPLWSLQRVDSGAYTNKAGTVSADVSGSQFTNGQVRPFHYTNYFSTDDVGSWSTFLLVDGDIAWVYNITLDSSNKVRHFNRVRHDSKEYDPRFRDTVRQAEMEVKSQMSDPTIDTRRPRRLLEDRLRAQGIYLRSLEELNPRPASSPGQPALRPSY
jgi:hypothetical protein